MGSAKDRRAHEEAIQADIAALRREIEAKAVGIDPSHRAIRERRLKVLSGDFRFFCYTYFPHHIWGEPSRFQAHFMERFPQLLMQNGGCIEWWIAPRGEAKSTLITKIGPVFIVAMGLLQSKDVRAELKLAGEPPPFLDYITFLGAETSMPDKLIEVCKTELCFNPQLKMDFPEICGPGKLWRIGECITANGVKLEGFGADQAIRGTFHGASRPKVLLGDDLITDQEAKSPTERENRWNWYKRAVKYLGPPDGSVKALNAATVLNADDPVSRAKKSLGQTVHHFRAIEQFPARLDLWRECEAIMRSQDSTVNDEFNARGQVPGNEDWPSYQFYRLHKAEMDAGAVISWPSVRALYSLMRDRADDLAAFGTEMQGDARAQDDKFFSLVAHWSGGILHHWRLFGACDPSLGQSEKADPSALIVGAYAPDIRKLHVVEADIKRRVPDKLMEAMLGMQRKYSCLAWAFENNAAFEYMRQSFIERGMEAGVPLPLVGVTATVAQEVRIESLQEFIGGLNPRILFHPGLCALLAELDTWPEKQTRHHYDGLTALHLLWMLSVTRTMKLPTLPSIPRRSKKCVDLTGY
jgi:hypothetical protein